MSARKTKGAATAADLRIGARVRQRRVEIGWSQEKLAAMLDVTFQQVQKYENGRNRIAASRLFQIAEIMETPIDWFNFSFCSPIKKTLDVHYKMYIDRTGKLIALMRGQDDAPIISAVDIGSILDRSFACIPIKKTLIEGEGLQ